MQPESKNEFLSLALSPALLETIAELGYLSPTPVQARSIPVLLQGKDLIGQSKTGSGKTVAFALPILEKLRLFPRTLQAAVLCPTRELCTQVAREIRKLGRKMPGLQVLILSGGVPKYPQKLALQKGVHIIVGTPGRILDHLIDKSLDLKQASTIVLDEADRMLDMGFEEDMEKILKALPQKRQMIFFSATFSSSIRALSAKHQTAPAHITIVDPKETFSDIKQTVYETPEDGKMGTLIKVIRQHQLSSCLVFCNQKVMVAEVTDALQKKGLSAGSLHGDLEQVERDRVMAKFRNESIRILVATDVAARGIDVAGLDAVINFDFPLKPSIYVHRIGRTGRAGKTGTAFTLLTPHERWKLQDIEAAVKLKLTPEKLAVSETESKTTQAEMETLYISGGRKEKVRPGDILGALTGEAGRLKGSDIGKIEIHDHYSYVAVSKSVAALAAKRLNDGKIKGRKFRVGITQ